ncbi:sensor histidine kinase [Bacillus niameyensis]|uniref:sensor histidine kinase n=1 Tax=Bacillus niameyensis TaxID=1522308 RepID=UPI00078276EC|nr:GHKL domain-containing protein [Bacillus niameyensis]
MIFSLFFFLVELCAIFAALFFTLKIRPTVLIVTAGMIVISVPAVLCYLFVTKWLGLIYLLISTIGFFFFYTKKLRVLLDVFILAIVIIISETISQNIKFSIFSHDSPIAIGTSIILFLLFFAFFIYLYILFIQKIWDSIAIPVASQLLIITISFITVAIVTLNLFISLSLNLYSTAMFNLLIQAIYFALILIFTFLLLRTSKKMNILKQKETEREQLLQYMQSLERINKDMQSFRHDYQNILLTMQGYINQNDIDGLKTYFNDRIVKVENRTIQNNYLFNQLDMIKIVELKGLLSSKVLLAEEWGIDINVEVPETIQAVEMNIIDLTRMVGILMDNAIEASADLKDGQLKIAFLKKVDHSLLIIFENRIGHESINMERLFEAGYSSKGTGHGMGLGLATARKIVNDYPNITMNTRIENGFFIHEVEISEALQKKYSAANNPVLTRRSPREQLQLKARRWSKMF